MIPTRTRTGRARLFHVLPFAVGLAALSLAPWQAGAQTEITIGDADCGPDADPAGCDYINPGEDADGYATTAGTDAVTVTVTADGYVLGSRHAIHIERAEDVALTVSNAGAVVQKGGTGAGIWVRKQGTATGGDITVRNTGTIETSGSEGIRAQHQGGPGAVTIESSGAIAATGLLLNSPAIWAEITSFSNTEKIDIDITGGALSSAAPNVATVTAVHRSNGDIEISTGETATITAPRNAGIAADSRGFNSAGRVVIDHAGRIEGESGIRVRLTSVRTTAAAMDTLPAIDIGMTGDIVTRVPADRLDPDALAERDRRTTGRALLAVPEIAARRLTGIEEGTGIDARVVDPRSTALSEAEQDRSETTVDRAALLASYDEEGGANAVLTAVRERVARHFGRLSDTPDWIKVDGSTVTFQSQDDYEDLSETDKEGYAAFDFDDDAHLRAWLLDDANALDLRGNLFSEAETTALAAKFSTRMTALTGSGVQIHTGDVAIEVGATAEGSAGSVDAEGHGIRALYARPHDSNGEIKVIVHKGAQVAAGKTGIFVSGAGRDATTMLLRHIVRVSGTVQGGTDAAIRIGIGNYAGEDGFTLETGTVTIGATGKLISRAGRPAILAAAGTQVSYNGGDADTSGIDGEIELLPTGIIGNIDLSAGMGASSVTLIGNFRVTGDIVFDSTPITTTPDNSAAETDTLKLEVAEGRAGFVYGDIVDVDTLRVTGAGMASVGSASFSASALEVDTSTLFIHGHLNLGESGTVTVTNSGKIVFASAEAKITAGGTVTLGMVDHDDDDSTDMVPGVYVAGGAGNKGLAQLIVDEDGDPVEIADAAVVAFDGEVPEYRGDLRPGETRPVTPTAGGTAAGDGDGAIGAVAVGGALALAFVMFDLFPGVELGLLDDDEDRRAGGALPSGVASFAQTPGPENAAGRGLSYRIVQLDGDAPMAASGVSGRAGGLEMALTMHLGGGFHVGLSGSPSVSLTTAEDRVSGSQYGARIGWRSNDAFVAAGYARADLKGDAAIRNISGLGELAGLQEIRHDRMYVSAGARVDLGRLSALPTLSLFRGSLEQDGYTAVSPAFRSRVPGLSQNYSGWKAGVAFAPRAPFAAGGLSWRPELKLTTTRVASDSDRLRLVQTRPGLSFATDARVARLPGNIHAVGAGLTVGGTGDWRLRGGYIGMVTDGKVDHAAVMKLGVKF